MRFLHLQLVIILLNKCKDATINSISSILQSKAAHRMAPASFWNSTPTPCSPTHCSFQRNSNLRATVHVLPSSRHEEKKSKKAASMDNVKKSVFSRNSRLTASTGLGKQYRKLSDGLISSKGELLNPEAKLLLLLIKLLACESNQSRAHNT